MNIRGNKILVILINAIPELVELVNKIRIFDA